MENKTIVREIFKKYLIKELERIIKCNDEKIKSLSEAIKLLEEGKKEEGIEEIQEMIDILSVEIDSMLMEIFYIEEDDKLFNLDDLLKDEYFNKKEGI